ncbi:signal peptide peptidase SppA [Methylovirgula sp. HY1]|uniref:signal peptide peptidase SppA n=1 Tax=Methylovirgula sp. HY1 TaxID=2822761 RepID=UPI001C5B6600|nr:signal peptide peptidase SppA [Methylovirgula sp. HY1]QXX76182.1 Putative signal peptide peptidase SppA [Methylovirgula sp. HY1]
MSNSSSADQLVDRRLLQRKLSFWRVVAFFFLIVLIGGLGWRLSGVGTPTALTPHIARLSIQGMITGDRGTLKLIDEIAKSSARGVILSIDSPGGTTTGAEKLYDAIRRLAAKKPVVAVVGTMAASGAYIAALASDRIVAHGNSLVGSIGVLIQYPNIAKLLDTIGVKIDAVKSSPLKAEPSGYEATSPQVRQVLTSLVDDSYTWFKNLVKKQRDLNDAELAAVDDGRVFTGRQALKVKLIDQIGGQREAIAWLVHEKGVPAGLPVRDWKGKTSLERLGLLGFSAKIAEVFGFSGLASAFDRVEASRESRLLDGLLSIWQVGNVD